VAPVEADVAHRREHLAGVVEHRAAESDVLRKRSSWFNTMSAWAPKSPPERASDEKPRIVLDPPARKPSVEISGSPLKTWARPSR
jgi:hypothetical protein